MLVPKNEFNTSFKENEIKFKTTVSKGTYIRALIDDICNKLNTVGTMSSLIRTKQGKFALEETFTLNDIESGKYELISIEKALSEIETITINEEIYNKVKNGAIINKEFNNDYANLIYNKKIVAIYKTYDKDDKLAKPFKMFIN